MSQDNLSVVMYTGPHCELCDHAQAIFDELAPDGVHFSKQNIREDSHLYHLYAVRIPVLKRLDNQAELGWPFDKESLEQFLQ